MKESQNSSDANFRKTTYVHFSIKNGILVCMFQDIEVMDKHIAEITVSERIKFLNGVAYPTLFDITRVKNSSKEARDYLANEGSELVIASAILVTSPVLRMMANFFIMVNKPNIPTRMFTTKTYALRWLSQFKQ